MEKQQKQVKQPKTLAGIFNKHIRQNTKNQNQYLAEDITSNILSDPAVRKMVQAEVLRQLEEK